MTELPFGQTLADLMTAVRDEVLALAPNLLAAAIIIVLGVVAARLVRGVVRAILGNAHRLLPSQQLRRRFGELLPDPSAVRLVGRVVYWLVVVLALTLATETLGLPVVTTWLSGLAGYLPRLLSAVLIGFVGILAGRMISELVAAGASAAGMALGRTLGKLIQAVLVLVTILIAMTNLGVDVTLLTSAVLVAIGALLLSAALSFAGGSRDAVRNILACHYLRKLYAVGDVIQVSDMHGAETRGAIVEIVQHGVIIDAPGGQVFIPAHVFSQSTSVLTIPSGERVAS